MFFKQVRQLLPVLVTAGMVIGVHGLQLTLVAVRGASHGFSVTLIGVMSAVYSLGFCHGVPVGHAAFWPVLRQPDLHDIGDGCGICRGNDGVDG